MLPAALQGRAGGQGRGAAASRALRLCSFRWQGMGGSEDEVQEGAGKACTCIDSEKGTNMVPEITMVDTSYPLWPLQC